MDVLRRASLLWSGAILVSCLLLSQAVAQAQCASCSDFGDGIAWGSITINPLTEASGMAASARNPGVLWTHNDGSRERIHAFSTNGAHLASFDLNLAVSDLEDIAIGPGPITNTSYIYIGDIGGSDGMNVVRDRVRILRVPEPLVELAWAGDARSADFDDVDAFTLVYPDGSYDAEALLVDPSSADIFVVTKENSGARVYRANLNTASPATSITMEFVRTVNFADVSGGAISADGTQIVLRREGFAMMWGRCNDDTVGAALAREGQSIPVIGPPTEANGEAITFLPDRTGYMTLSEGADPTLYFFQARCAMAPRFTQPLVDRSGFIGGLVTLSGIVVGYPPPEYQWFFNGAPLDGQTNSSLTISPVSASAGQYQLTASNESGVVTSSATLTVRTRPDLRITEVQSSTAAGSTVPTADWWELTSFETQPVSLGGWRFNDSGGGLDDPFTLPAGFAIAPGETIIFVEGLSPAQFRNWWGAANLPAGLQIVTYSGSGLSLGAGGDGIRLWNDTETNAVDTIASVDFGAAQIGVTFTVDSNTGLFGALSQEGVNGAFRAAASPGDIGSPGRTRGAAAPVSLTARLVESQIRIEFNAEAGRAYALETRESLTEGEWSPTGDTLQATSSGPVFFEKDPAAPVRFYRVRAE
jgi:hypothetical protein